jgi:hypothetical protein
MSTHSNARSGKGLEGVQAALEQVAGAVDAARAAVVAQMGSVDVGDLKQRGSRLAASAQGQGSRYADKARKQGRRYAFLARRHGPRYAEKIRLSLEQRVRPRPKRARWPLALALTGAVAAVGVGVGVALYDRERRQRLAGGVGKLQQGARQRYAELGGLTGAVGKVTGRGHDGASSEAALETKAREAISAGGTPPESLKVSVEGRTVYLRGAVDDPAFVDAAVERIHAIEGVVAVVNLTTTTAGASAKGEA